MELLSTSKVGHEEELELLSKHIEEIKSLTAEMRDRICILNEDQSCLKT